MPPNLGAASATTVYRRSLGVQRDGTVAAIVSKLREVDLDLPTGKLTGKFREFNTYAAEMVASGVSRAADLSDLYVDTYLVAAGLTPDGAEFSQTEEVHRGLAAELVTDHVIPALLWRLASRAGRDAAFRYAAAVADRQTRGALTDAARYRISARIETERAISGWRRVTGPSTCNLCAADAGVLFTDRDGLADRCHPSCRCSAEPVLNGITETVTRTAPLITRERTEIPGYERLTNVF